MTTGYRAGPLGECDPQLWAVLSMGMAGRHVHAHSLLTVARLAPVSSAAVPVVPGHDGSPVRQSGD